MSTDIHVGRRVRVLSSDYPPFVGLEGRVVERDPRLPFSFVELDRLPIGCSSRSYWFEDKRLEWPL